MNVYIGGAKDYSAMRGPCSEGFHIPLNSEVEKLNTIYKNIVPSGSRNYIDHLKFSSQYKTLANYDSSGGVVTSYVVSQGEVSGGYNGHMWTSTGVNQKLAKEFFYSSNNLYTTYYDRSKAHGLLIRPFKDTPVIPDGGWTVLYQGTGETGVFYNSSLQLVTLYDGNEYLTIKDRDSGASSAGGIGYLYQRGNNNGFNIASGTYRSGFNTTGVNASSYGPGNYYSSGKLIFVFDRGNTYWDYSNNNNLRGGVTGVVMSPAELKNAYIGNGLS